MSHRNQQIVKLYTAGYSLREIGLRFGLSHERIRQLLIEAGAPLRTRAEGRRELSKEGSEKLRRKISKTQRRNFRNSDAYQRSMAIARAHIIDGLTYNQVAAKYGVTPNAVAGHVRRMRNEISKERSEHEA